MHFKNLNIFCLNFARKKFFIIHIVGKGKKVYENLANTLISILTELHINVVKFFAISTELMTKYISGKF